MAKKKSEPAEAPPTETPQPEAPPTETPQPEAPPTEPPPQTQPPEAPPEEKKAKTPAEARKALLKARLKPRKKAIAQYPVEVRIGMKKELKAIEDGTWEPGYKPPHIKTAYEKHMES